jgi:hypothetical protein
MILKRFVEKPDAPAPHAMLAAGISVECRHLPVFRPHA